MEPEVHLFVSAGLASAFYLVTGDVLGSVTAFAGGFFIDLDHVIEYWLYRGKISLRGEFFSNYPKKIGRLYILFHSYELLIAVYLAALVSKSFFFWGLLAGMSLHMVMDLIGNNAYLKTYSLVYRLSKNFKSKYFFRR